ncbi:hypothetical protein HYFRA_00007675 [Hymenoscyphus fraxineus]|uniref:Uncharacterized protein n=1 Tax=Hymenoscyphus fraxineus TaxID=746836 RepID=A0A9N9KT20_9HELO|nr:hypothetical protein HYFRA_00007675 [Hymenoscyphus fraxineus]
MKLSLAITLLSVFTSGSVVVAQGCLEKNSRCDDQVNYPGACCSPYVCRDDEFGRVDYKLCREQQPNWAPPPPPPIRARKKKA